MEHLEKFQELLNDALAIVEKARNTGSLQNIEKNLILQKLSSAYDIVFHVEEKVTKHSAKKVEKESFSDEVKQPQKRVKEVDTPPIEVEETRPVETESRRIDYVGEVEKGEVLGEKFQGTRKSRNEVIAESNARVDVQTKLQNRPIANLQKAIGINEKFLFTKELFGGNATLYSETLNYLNGLSDLNDAIIYLQENFDWDEGNEAVSKFIDLLRRKYS